MNKSPVDAPIQIALHEERPVPPAALRALHDHAGWDRPATEAELSTVLTAGPAVAAWDGDELVGFVRALSDGRLSAYVEDMVVHERHRHRGVGSALLARLLEQLEAVGVVLLFCTSDTVPFYQQLGFRPTENVLMLRKQRERPRNAPHTSMRKEARAHEPTQTEPDC